MWFYLKKAEFDFNKICTHYGKKAVTILLSWKQYCPDNFVFKEQTEGEGFGEGFEEGPRTGGEHGVRLQAWIIRMHPLEVVGPPKIKDSSGLMA